MDIDRLREYIELSRQLNFTAAARSLHLSQPTLSNHIRALERETGVLLLERSSSLGCRLTLAGQRFLTMAKDIVAAHDSALEDLRAIQRDIEGTVRIRLPRREYSSPLLNYTHEFQELHPHIEIVFLPWVDEDGLTDVASGKVDCAFVGYDIQAEAARTPNAVGQIAYDRREILLWVDRGDSLASQTTVHPGQVANRDFAIPANQKNESWRVMMQSFSQIIGTGITIDEKYCDSLEDFLMNRVGSHDLVVNNREIFEMPGVNMRRDRILLPFDPPLTMPLPIAYTSQTGNFALQLFIRFLEEKYAQTHSLVKIG